MLWSVLTVIRVRTHHGQWGYTPGYINGNGLAFHKEVLPNGIQGCYWDITHLASGLSILPCVFEQQEQAVKCIEELEKRGVNWHLSEKRLQRNKKLPELIKNCIEWALNEVVVPDIS
jgi:hypothetical protein